MKRICLIALMTVYLCVPTQIKSQASSIEKGNAYFFQGRYTDALRYYMQVYSDQTDPDASSYALFLSAKCYLNMGNQDMALRNLWRSVSDYPDSQWADSAYLLLASIRERENRGRLPEALILYETIPSRYSRSHKLAEAYLGAARVKTGLNYHAFAHADMERVVERLGSFEETAQIHYDIAAIYGHPQNPERDVDQALEHLAIVINRYPTDDLIPQAVLYKARLNWERGERTKALEGFRQIVSNHSGKPIAEYAQESIARIHEEMGDLQRAVNAYRTMLINFSFSDFSRRRLQSEIDRFTGVIATDDKPTISAWFVEETQDQKEFQYEGDVEISIHKGFISGDRAIVDYNDKTIRTSGNVRLRWDDTYVIICDTVEYDVAKREAQCKGNVHVKHRTSQGIRDRDYESVVFSFREGKLIEEKD
jgi:tetratricopeptide (TPR) repeat protein